MFGVLRANTAPEEKYYGELDHRVSPRSGQEAGRSGVEAGAREERRREGGGEVVVSEGSLPRIMERMGCGRRGMTGTIQIAVALRGHSRWILQSDKRCESTFA